MLDFQPMSGISLEFLLCFFTPLLICAIVFVCIAPKTRAERCMAATAICVVWTALIMTMFRRLVGFGHAFNEKTTPPFRASVITALAGLSLIALLSVIADAVACARKARRSARIVSGADSRP